MALTAKQEQKQQQIIESGDGDDACRFARDVPGADVAALQQVVLERGDGETVCRFARDIEGADTQALQQVVLERGSGDAAYWFARFVPGADIAALFSAAEAGGFTRLNDAQIAEFRALQQWVVDNTAPYIAIERGEGRLVAHYDFAVWQQTVIEKGNGTAAYAFASHIGGADVPALFAAAEAGGFTGLNDDQIAEFRARRDQALEPDNDNARMGG